MANASFRRLAVLGLGLMGGSFALAARTRGMSHELVGFDPDAQALDHASTRGMIDQAFDSPVHATDGADAVILAAPVRANLCLLESIHSTLAPGALVLDLSSTKREIVRAMARLPGSVLAVGGHPMAGKEVSGIEAATATLFDGATFALCPTARTTDLARVLSETLVGGVGAHAIWLDAAAHDEAVARVSHLPFLLSAVLAQVAAPEGPARILAASGYRDVSRLAGSSPTMMLDILLTNEQPVRAAVSDARASLDELDALLAAADEAGLRRWMERARERR
jgi:prephenate dehydrogenase